jgi:DNA-directed RNA polymerase subunit RPC12/RpoP
MKEYVFIACPYCSHAIIEKRFKKTSFSIPPLEYQIYTKREQRSEKGFSRGKGSGHRGFYMMEGSGKTILQLMDGTKEEQQIAIRITDRIKTIYNEYRNGGLIK